MLGTIVRIMAALGFYKAAKEGKSIESSAWAAVKAGCLGVILYFVFGIGLFLLGYYMVEMSK